MLTRLVRNNRGAAAAEMVLVTPLLLVILFGSVELGNYFMNEHSLVKAVRDGARFAARQSFSGYPDCSGSPDTGTVVAPTQNVVMYGFIDGTSVLTPNIERADIAVTTQCFPGTVGGETMSGLYEDRENGAQIVTVSAAVPYRSVLGSVFGFSGLGKKLNATSQAAVTGL